MSATVETQRRYFILLDDDVILDVDHEQLVRAANMDVVIPCSYGWTLDYDTGEPWPCGHTHSGPDFYHLAPGKTWDDWRAATAAD